VEGIVPGDDIKSTNSFEHFLWWFHFEACCRNRKYIYINFVEKSVKYFKVVNHETGIYMDYLHCWHIV